MLTTVVCFGLNLLATFLGVYVSVKYADHRVNSFMAEYMPPKDELKAARESYERKLKVALHG